MEPEALPLDKALQGLTILALIPVVAFALWSEYVTRPKNKDETQPIAVPNGEFEVEKVRLGSLFVILFQCTLFIGSTEVQAAYPILTQIIFILSILLQILVQYQAEKKLRTQDHKPDELLGIILRIGMSWLVGGLLYLGILILCVKGAALSAEKIQASPAIETILLLSGGLFGVALGFGINFAFGPVYLKMMLPTVPLQDSSLQAQFESCFLKAGAPPPLFRIIELNALKISDVLIAGLQKGKGPFSPVLFLSRTILSTLLPRELDAIVLNQVSRVVLHHLKKRFLFSMTLIVNTGLLAVFAVLIGQEFLPGPTALEIFAPAVALASFLSSFKFLSQQAQKHELEADLYSINTLGVSFEDFSSALRKLDLAISFDPESSIQAFPKGHPDTERRLALLKTHLGEPQESQSERLKAS